MSLMLRAVATRMNSIGYTYAALNAADKTNVNLSGGNLIATMTSNGAVRADHGKLTGKFYFEGTLTTAAIVEGIGCAPSYATQTNFPGIATVGFSYNTNGGLNDNNGANSAVYASYTTGAVIGVAVDLDAKTVKFYKNNTLQGTFTYTAPYAGMAMYPSVGANGAGGVWTLNFGATPFTYTPPAGYSAWGYVSGTDEYPAASKYLLHFDSALTADVGLHAFTNTGSVTLDTTNKKYGAGSALFAGTTQSITTPSNADLHMSSSGSPTDFTVECWIKAGTGGAGNLSMICGACDSGGGTAYRGGPLMWLTASGFLAGGFQTGGTFYNATGTVNLRDNTWHHVAVSRFGTIIRIYVDGTIAGTTTGVSVSDSAPTGQYAIGQFGEFLGYPWFGNIDDFRITKGVGRYTGNFTPPSQALPDPYPSFPGGLANGLVMWLDGNDATTVTSSGGAVSAWADKSGSGRTFTQSTGARKPTVDTTTFSGLSALSFNTDKNLVASSAITLPAACTFFMVTYEPAGGVSASTALVNNASSIQSGTDFLGFYAAGGQFFLQATSYQSAGSVIRYADSSGAGGISSVKAQATFLADGIAANFKIRRNGSNLTIASSSPGVTTGFSLNQIGETAGALYTSSGVIAEIVAYNRTLTATEYAAVESYLKTKWGTP